MPNSRKIGLLAFAHPVVRLGLVDALVKVRPNWSLLPAETMDEAAGRLAASAVDFMVISLRLPGLGGRWGLWRLRAVRPAVRVAVLLAADDLAMIAAMRTEGVQGIVGMEEPFEQVVRAVVAVASGEHYELRSEAAPVVEPDPVPELTPQQNAVLRLAVEGFPVHEIARRLGVGVGTVKAHLARAYTRLGVHSRLQAVVKLGWAEASGADDN